MNLNSPSVKDLFDHALEIESPTERQAYLEQACAATPDLRPKVEALLQAYQDAGSFMESPAPKLAATVDEATCEGPGAVIGPYKLLEQIGEGGFGVVFMAEQTQPVRRKVALKVIKPGMDTRQVIARFEAERQALALMEHPNIARVLDAGTTGGEPGGVSPGRPYFVMELVRGLSMTDNCDQHNLPVRERLELFLDVCHAVQHAHQKGIIHRDIKPSNVLVTLHDGKPVVKVIDFGIAKAMGQQLTDKTLFTNFAQMIGTPLYMSPEQAEMSGLDVDTRSDIYSLGVLLYELLTGTTPFDKERLKQASFDEIRRIIREEEPPKPSTRMSTIGQAATTASEKRRSDPRKLSRLFRGELDWIVMKALEKDRNRRYETASAFAADVQRYLNDEPVQACPPSARYRLRKFVRRHKGKVTAAVAFVLLLVLGVIGLIIDESRVKAEADQKEQAQEARLEEAGERVKALEGEKKALERAEADFQLARQAVDDFLDKVTLDPELAALGDFHPLRQKLLASALPFYEEWTRRRRGDKWDKWMGIALAETHGRLAGLRAETGDAQQALADYDEALSIYARLVKESPDDPGRQWRLAGCLMTRGNLLRDLRRRDEALTAQQDALGILQGLTDQYKDPRYRAELAANHGSLGAALSDLDRPKEALAAFEQSVLLFEKLTEDFRDNPDYRWQLATSHHNVGHQLYVLERYADALGAHDRALVIREKLVKDHPSDPRYLRDLALSHNGRGMALHLLRRLKEAQAAMEEAVKIQEQLALRYPSAVTHAESLGGGYCILANEILDDGRPKDALDWYAKAIRTLEPLAAGEGRTPNARRYLRNAHWGRAQTLYKLDRNAEAARDWARAAELDDGPNRARFRLEKAVCLALAGEHAPAVAEALALAEGDFGPGTYYDLAAVCALATKAAEGDAALKEQYGAHAVELLKKAAAKGFKDGNELKNDPNFAVLRPRKDFQELLRKLGTGEKP